MKIGWTKAVRVFQDCCCLYELVIFVLGDAYFMQNMAGNQRVRIMNSVNKNQLFLESIDL
jgi:hypothetical protein